MTYNPFTKTTATLNDFFDDPEDKLPEGVHLIDMSQLMIATISHTFKPEDPISEGMIRHLILDTMRYNMTKFKEQYPITVLAFDSSKGYWRRDIAPYYKRNRKEKRDADPRDWEMIFSAINKITEEFKENMPYHVIKVDKVEADDIIAVLTKKFSVEGRQVLINSGDGDYTQLHKYKNVKQWAPVQKAWKKCKYGSPYKDLMVKCVKGDAKDGVASIKCRSDFIISRLEGERAKPIATKWLEKIFDAEDPKSLMTEEEARRFDENRELIDFEFIPDNIEYEILLAWEKSKPAPRGKIYNYFVTNALVKMLQKIGEF